MFYDEIDAVLGCRDIVTLTNVSILLRKNVSVFPDVTGEEGSFSPAGYD